MSENTRVVRKSQGDGRWFSGDHDDLLVEVEGYINQAELPEIKTRTVGIISPHAGYLYSGAVSGYSFRALRDTLKSEQVTVVVLGFSHSGGFPGVALMDGDAIETPIAESELDIESSEYLVGSSEYINFDYRPHIEEHSAENQIPFVQVALPSAKLVVALIGDHKSETRHDLAKVLHKLASKRRIIVVASTDLLHDANYELVSETDKNTLSLIAKLDEDGLERAWSFEEQVCCGIGPVLTMMQFAKLEGLESGTILKYCNSGDAHPESRGSWVVGYGSVVF